MLAIFSFVAFNAATPHEGALRGVDIVRLSGLIALALVLALRSTTSFTLMRRTPGQEEECGLLFDAQAVCGKTGYVCTVYVCNLFLLPTTLIAIVP